MRVVVSLPRVSGARYASFLRHLKRTGDISFDLVVHDPEPVAAIVPRILPVLIRAVLAFETASRLGGGLCRRVTAGIPRVEPPYDAAFCIGPPPRDIGELIGPARPIYEVHDVSNPGSPGFSRLLGAAGGVCDQLSVDVLRHNPKRGGETVVCDQVVVRGRLKLSDNIEIAQKIQATYMAIAARRDVSRIASGDVLCLPSADAFPILSDPPLGAAFRAYLSSVFGIVSGRVLRRLCKLAYPGKTWHVFFSLARDEATGAPKGHEAALPQTSDRFFADPFLIHHGDKTYCFVEEKLYRAPKAHIAAFELVPGGGPRAFGAVLERPYHMSFPFVFEHAGRVLMCPETAKCGRIQLFGSRTMPYDWELQREWDLGAPAVDPIIFWHEGRWWLLVGFDRASCGEYCSDLSIFYCDDLFRDNWTAHAANPISSDCRYSRNGGWLVRSGRLPIRVGQYQTTRIYGQAMSFFKINELTPTWYSETMLHEARDLKGFHSAHHMSAIPQGYCFDARC